MNKRIQILIGIIIFNMISPAACAKEFKAPDLQYKFKVLYIQYKRHILPIRAFGSNSESQCRFYIRSFSDNTDQLKVLELIKTLKNTSSGIKDIDNHASLIQLTIWSSDEAWKIYDNGNIQYLDQTDEKNLTGRASYLSKEEALKLAKLIETHAIDKDQKEEYSLEGVCRKGEIDYPLVGKFPLSQ